MNEPGGARFDTTLAARFPLAGVVLAAAILFVYAGVYRAPYVLDDAPTISRAAYGGLAAVLSQQPTRALPNLSFALVEKAGGGPAFHHAFNIVLHIANALLVFSLLSVARRLCAPSLPGYVPLLGALLWAVHPLQTSAVTYISQRYAGVAAACYLGSVVCYLRAREERIAGRRFGSFPHLGWYLGALFLAFLAVFTKENTFTLPIALALCEWLLVGRQAAEPWSHRVALILPFLVTPILLLVSVPTLDNWKLGPVPGGPVVPKTEGPVHGVHGADLAPWGFPSRRDYALTQPGVLVRYLQLWLMPVNQVFDADVKTVSRLLDTRALVPAALLGLLVAGALTQARRRPLITFGVLWFLVTISVESSFQPLADLMFEHRVLLPSVGLVMCLLGLLGPLFRRRPLVITAAIMAVTLALAGATVARNRVMADPISLWSDNVRKSPGKLRGWILLANAFAETGQLDFAEQTLAQATSVHGQSARLQFELGTIQMRRGNRGAAENSYLRAIKLNPYYPEAWYNFGTILAQTGREVGAEQAFRFLLNTGGGYVPEAHYNLGVLYLRQGKAPEAARQLEEAVRKRPGLAPAHYQLSLAYQNLGRLEDARREAATAARLQAAEGGE